MLSIRTWTMSTHIHGTSTSLEPLVFIFCVLTRISNYDGIVQIGATQFYFLIAQCSVCVKCATDQHFQQKLFEYSYLIPVARVRVVLVLELRVLVYLPRAEYCLIVLTLGPCVLVLVSYVLETVCKYDH